MVGYQILTVLAIISFYLTYAFKLFAMHQRKMKQIFLLFGENKSEKVSWIEAFVLVVFFANVILQGIHLFSGSLFETTYFWYSSFSHTIGITLIFLGTIFFWLALLSMRENWRLGINSVQRTLLVTWGIFRMTRNPEYLGLIFLYLGFFLVCPNFFTLLGAILGMIVLHLQILEEEFSLAVRFGKPFFNYKYSVRRYI